MDEESIAGQIIRKQGLCPECGGMMAHHVEEPFASCLDCGLTSEWYTLDTPYMKLQKKLYELKHRTEP